MLTEEKDLQQYTLDGVMIGKRIKTARKAKHYTQEELAAKCHCTATHISNIHDIVRMYIPLKKSGLPVYMSNPDECIAYLREEDMVGIVPDDTMLMYKQAYFDEPINDFYHYDPLTDEAIKHLIKWYPIDMVTLRGE